jgi:predicted amidohydrolase YtcJ
VVLLHGGTIRTLDTTRPVAGGLLLQGSTVAALLDDTDDAPAGVPRFDLEGGCALPGFTDAHVHFPAWALARRELSLLGATSLEEAVGRVGAAAPAGGWIRGGGWRDEHWGTDRPSAAALDAVRADVPIAMRAHDHHSLWLNSAALALAEDDLETPGGVVERDEDGAPTGVLREEAAWRYEKRFPPTFDETLTAMRAALPAAAEAGVVAVHDKDGGRGAPALFGALRAEAALTLRVWQSLPADADDLTGADYVKAFMDGTLGSRTARLLDGTGVEITSTEGLAALIRRAAAHDLPLAVHAIGDRANRDALDAFEATHAEWAPKGLRPRIEHAQCVHPDDVPRFAALGVTASVQFTHATSDRDVADRLWGERAAHAYPYRSLRAAGAVLAGGSDAPIEALDPLAGLRAAVLRTDSERPPWRPEQAIGLHDALAAFTTAPAWLEHAEDRRGRLAPGLAADVVVLDRDPFEDLKGARVVATMLGGLWVHLP